VVCGSGEGKGCVREREPLGLGWGGKGSRFLYYKPLPALFLHARKDAVDAVSVLRMHVLSLFT
jgi:hypothetical protein